MHLATETAVHALQLLKHAGENNHGLSGPAKLAMYLPLASRPAFQQPQSRRLEEAEVDLFAFMKSPSMEKIEDQCGVHVEELISAGIADGLKKSDDFGDPDMDAILSAFGDFEGQRMCSDEDITSVMGAYTDFMTCTGIATFIGKVAVSGFDMDKIGDDIEEKCGSLVPESLFMSEVFLGGDFLDAAPSSEDFLQCLGTIFGPHNVIGDFLRDTYEHPNRYCQCAQELGNKVPDCTIEEEGIKVSLSLIKSGTCVFGVGCDAYKDYCSKETAILEKCLPETDDEYDCTDAMEKCVQSGSFLTAVPAIISTTLPDTCQDVAGEATIKKYESFQKKCIEKKDFLALIGKDSSAIEMETKDQLTTTNAVEYIRKEEQELVHEPRSKDDRRRKNLRAI